METGWYLDYQLKSLHDLGMLQYMMTYWIQC